MIDSRSVGGCFSGAVWFLRQGLWVKQTAAPQDRETWPEQTETRLAFVPEGRELSIPSGIDTDSGLVGMVGGTAPSRITRVSRAQHPPLLPWISEGRTVAYRR